MYIRLDMEKICHQK